MFKIGIFTAAVFAAGLLSSSASAHGQPRHSIHQAVSKTRSVPYSCVYTFARRNLKAPYFYTARNFGGC
jgi:hypothetical protein